MTLKATQAFVDRIIWAFEQAQTSDGQPNPTTEELWYRIVRSKIRPEDEYNRLMALSAERSQVIYDVIQWGQVPGLELAIGDLGQIIVRRSLPEALDNADRGANSGQHATGDSA